MESPISVDPNLSGEKTQIKKRLRQEEGEGEGEEEAIPEKQKTIIAKKYDINLEKILEFQRGFLSELTTFLSWIDAYNDPDAVTISESNKFVRDITRICNLTYNTSLMGNDLLKNLPKKEMNIIMHETLCDNRLQNLKDALLRFDKEVVNKILNSMMHTLINLMDNNNEIKYLHGFFSIPFFIVNSDEPESVKIVNELMHIHEGMKPIIDDDDDIEHNMVNDLENVILSIVYQECEEETTADKLIFSSSPSSESSGGESMELAEGMGGGMKGGANRREIRKLQKKKQCILLRRLYDYIDAIDDREFDSCEEMYIGDDNIELFYRAFYEIENFNYDDKKNILIVDKNDATDQNVTTINFLDILTENNICCVEGEHINQSEHAGAGGVSTPLFSGQSTFVNDDSPVALLSSSSSSTPPSIGTNTVGAVNTPYVPSSSSSSSLPFKITQASPASQASSGSFEIHTRTISKDKEVDCLDKYTILTRIKQILEKECQPLESEITKQVVSLKLRIKEKAKAKAKAKVLITIGLINEEIHHVTQEISRLSELLEQAKQEGLLEDELSAILSNRRTANQRLQVLREGLDIIVSDPRFVFESGSEGGSEGAVGTGSDDESMNTEQGGGTRKRRQSKKPSKKTIRKNKKKTNKKKTRKNKRRKENRKQRRTKRNK